MAIITLKELVFLNKQSSSPISNIQPSKSSIQQQQFQLLVRQKRMGLNIEPLLNPIRHKLRLCTICQLLGNILLLSVKALANSGF